MKIIKVMNAAIGATQERRFVTKNSKNNSMDKIDAVYYNRLIKSTGPSTHRPVQIAKSWYKAYKLNMQTQNLIENLNAPFKKKGAITEIIEKVFNRG